jgi:hypothetical protein
MFDEFDMEDLDDELELEGQEELEDLEDDHADMEEFDDWDMEDQSLMFSLFARDLISEGELEAADLEDLREDGVLDDDQYHAVMEDTRNIVRLNKSAKKAALTEKAILVMAKQARDPEYKKYQKFRKLMLKSRAKLQKKYGSRAKGMAMKMAANGKRRRQKKGTKKVASAIQTNLKNPTLRGGSTKQFTKKSGFKPKGVSRA